jgi:hypothetical protein
LEGAGFAEGGGLSESSGVGEVEDEVEAEGRSYAISDGTLSDVMPFPPGQLPNPISWRSDETRRGPYVFITSTSSGVEVYTAATLTSD